MAVPDVLRRACSILERSGINISTRYVRHQGGSVHLIISEHAVGQGQPQNVQYLSGNQPADPAMQGDDSITRLGGSNAVQVTSDNDNHVEAGDNSSRNSGSLRSIARSRVIGSSSVGNEAGAPHGPDVQSRPQERDRSIEVEPLEDRHRLSRRLSRRQELRNEDIIRFDIFKAAPADVLHIFCMFLGPDKWWLISQSGSESLSIMRGQLPLLLLRGNYFELAVRSGYCEVVRALLERAPCKSEMCLKCAGCHNTGLLLGSKRMDAKTQMVTTILDVASSQGISLSTGALNSMFRRVASGLGDVRLARRLVDAGVDPLFWQMEKHQYDDPWATPFLRAVYRGFEEMVSFLLDANADVDRRAPVKSGWHPTALVVAVGHERPSIVKLLLQHGAEPAMLKAFELQNFCGLVAIPRSGTKVQLIARVQQWQQHS